MIDLKNQRLCLLASHPDDLELGLGGTLNQIKSCKPTIIIFSDTVETNSDVIISELKKSMAVYDLQYTCLSYPNMGFVNKQKEIRTDVFNLKQDHDIFFAPQPTSQHLDHRILGTALDDIMLEKTVIYYEDIRAGQNNKVNFWNEISRSDLNTKMLALAQYATQHKTRHYFQNNSVENLAAMRGNQIGVPLAEAFLIHRLVS